MSNDTKGNLNEQAGADLVHHNDNSTNITINFYITNRRTALELVEKIKFIPYLKPIINEKPNENN
jgi:hypothetical protein